MTAIEQLPFVTVWVAARNEQANIINCLQKLQTQDYPIEKLEILIGNDQSTDDTEQLVRHFISDKPQFKLINITKTINGQRGKANVLANLYTHSRGSIFLITDADVSVPGTWVRSMVAYFQKNNDLGHLVGISSISSPGLFGHLQALDWLWALTLLKLASLFRIPLTGLGNNSGCSRAAYEASGGYAAIPFSITEDFALFHAIIQQGFGFHNGFNRQVFAKTTAMLSMKDFLHQRKRWMVGALQCPWWVVLFLYIQALFPIILIVIALIGATPLALSILLAKYFLQIVFLLPTIFILKEYRLIPTLLCYEPYAWLWGFTMVVFYFLPIKIDWKGRMYSTND